MPACAYNSIKVQTRVGGANCPLSKQEVAREKKEGCPSGGRASLGLPRPHPSERERAATRWCTRNHHQGKRAGNPAAATRCYTENPNQRETRRCPGGSVAQKRTMPRQTLRIRDDHDLRTVFECFDLDESGTVDVRVIPEMIRTLMYEVPAPQQVQDLLARYDADGSGSLDFSEFQALLQDYESPYDIWIEQTQEELGLVLRNRKDGHVCIVSVCPELCPALYEAARRGVMVPGHRIASIDGQRYKDAREAADYLRKTVREQRVLITLEAPEPISSRGHHVPMPWWQHSVLVNTALVEDGETRLRRDRMRASSSNTTADSYWHGHLHSAYV